MSDPTVPAQHPDAQPVPGAEQMGAIEVKSSFFVLAFLLFLFPAKATINGSAPLNQGWGVQVYPIPAGRHQVQVWCPYFGVMKMGDATHVVDVVPGQATVVEWKCPWLIFLPGTWVNLGMRPIDVNMLPAGPGHADPVPGAAAPVQQPVQQSAPQPAAVAGPPAGWHPDPQGQAALRYWDGQQWTEHTNDGQPTAG